MKAAVVHRFDRALAIEEVPVPERLAAGHGGLTGPREPIRLV